MPDTAELLAVLRQSGFEFDQAIHYRKRNFLHVSLKKTGTNRMQVLLRLLVLVFLLSGCGGNRKSQRREVATSMDSVRFSSCETNLRKRDIHLTDTAVWNLHRVVISLRTVPVGNTRKLSPLCRWITGGHWPTPGK